MVREPGMPKHNGGETSPPEEVLPRQFGKYTLLRQLATGGMATVYLALQRAVAGFEKLVVIKRILPQLSRDQAFVEMLLHEARIAATLSHPNVVQTFDVGEVQGGYYIAMEHVNGEDIRSIVRAMKRKSVTQFPLEHALTIVLGVCAGLAYAHEKRDLNGQPLSIVHRDVSPQNILVTFEGDVKVVDFGIAKSAQVAASEKAAGQPLKGKVPYMSPEQGLGEPVDHRSDIFALGIVLFELTTGRRLFKAKSTAETIKLTTESNYPRPSQVRPGYPLALDRIVMKALSRSPDQRYQSARDLQGDLEAFIRQQRVAASSVSLAQWMEMLFEDKIAQQKEALQDVKHLADVLASQYSDPGERYSITQTPASMRTPSASLLEVGQAGIDSVSFAPRRSRWPWLAAAGLALGLAAGAVYIMQSGTAAPEPPKETAAAPTGERAAPEQAKGRIAVQTEPEGCDVWLNGELQKSVSPTTLENLPLDRALEVKVSKNGFESHVETVKLSQEQPDEALEIQMVRGSVTVVLKVDPKPFVFLDGKKWEGSTDRIEELSAGEHKMVLSRPGYVPRTFTFVAKKGEPKVIEATLSKAQDEPAAAAQATSEPEPPKPKGNGKVNVAARGGYCSNVTIYGRSVGPSPVAGIVVPEGFASVSCRTADGKTLRSGAQVRVGETTRVSFTIR